MSAAHLYPRIFVPVEFRIRDAVNRMGKTILTQVRCLRYDWGFVSGTTLGNDGTLRFQILDNHLG